MKLLYDDESPAHQRNTARGVRNENHGHDTDAHNLRIIQSDPRLQSILRVYSRQNEAGRAALAQFADQLPPVQVQE